tara:strand:+ start:197 stop:628 length:432 start_codon:yes stop_codon:yes gene_type:complete
MRRRHFRGAKMMRTLESAIITLMSSSSGRGGQKSRTRFRGQGHSLPPFFCEGRPSPKQAKRAKKKKKSKHNSQGDRAPTTKGWRAGGLSNHEKKARKKRLEEEHHYYVTRGQERDAASPPTTTRRRRKYLSFPRNKHARKKSL